MPTMTQFLSHATLPELIGVVGFCLYVTNYTMLTLRRITNSDVQYYIMNVAAAGCVLIGLSAHFNLAAAMVKAFWIAISVIGIALRLIERSRAPKFGHRAVST